jgi:hypothetical protein
MSGALTVAQIRRRKCGRCGSRPGYAQWHVCSDNHVNHVLCADCDIALNKLVLEWAGVPDAKATIARYRRRVKRDAKRKQ